MFPRIVSQLSLTPQANGRLTAYAQRLRRQQSVRSLITIAAIVALLLQLIVFIWPASSATKGTLHRAAGPVARQLEAASHNLPALNRGWDLGIIVTICLLALWSQIRYRQLRLEVSLLRGGHQGNRA